MPGATSLGLSKLLGALGFKQGETFPTIEAIQPVAIVGHWDDLVPNPSGPKALWGGREEPVTYRAFAFEIKAKGGAYIDVFNLTTDTGVGVVPCEIRINDIGWAGNIPATKNLTPVVTSHPGAGPITTIGYQGVPPVGFTTPQLDRPTIGVHQLGKTQSFGHIYVPAGKVFELVAEDGDLMLAAEIREIPEAFPAR